MMRTGTHSERRRDGREREREKERERRERERGDRVRVETGEREERVGFKLGLRLFQFKSLPVAEGHWVEEERLICKYNT
eukprot:1329750-Amorphochlora_amoeboformis.AAC.1